MILGLKITAILILAIILVIRYIARQAVKIMIISGKGEGQVRVITGYDPKTKTIKVNHNFNPIPDHTSKYKTWR